MIWVMVFVILIPVVAASLFSAFEQGATLKQTATKLVFDLFTAVILTILLTASVSFLTIQAYMMVIN